MCNPFGMETELIGVPQLADVLGVDQSTIHRRIYRGDLTPYITVGNRALFLAADVDAIKRGEQHIKTKESTK